MEEFNIHEVAEENNLDVISTTTGKNGYPQSVKYAITGFPNFSEAEKLAEKYGLRITTFWKKAGWQLYVRDRNTTFEPMRISAENYGDDYMAFDSSSVESFYEDEVKPLLDDINSLEDLEKFVSARKELLDEIKSIDETQLVIACHGHYYETVDRETMEWSFDSKTYVIGVTTCNLKGMYLKDDYLLVESTTTDGGCSKDVHVLNKQSLEILEILQDATILGNEEVFLKEHPSPETVTDDDIESAWVMLADVPVNSKGKIDRDFLYWEKGTDRKVIWNWFDQNHSLGIGFHIDNYG